MHQLYQNPQLRILLIMNLVGLGVLLILIITLLCILIRNWSKDRDQQAKDSGKLKKFIERLKGNGIPSEISGALDELHENMVIFEESTGEQIKTFFALVEGLEEKMKLVDNTVVINKNKMVAALHSIVARLKIATRDRVDKHADNFFKRSNRIESEIKELEARLLSVETLFEAMQILNGDSEVNGTDDAEKG